MRELTILDKTSAMLLHEAETFCSQYQNIVISDKKEGKSLRAEVRKKRNEIDDARKAFKNKYLAPYNLFEKEIKSVEAVYDILIDRIDQQVKEFEAYEYSEKLKKIREIYNELIPEDHPTHMDLANIVRDEWKNSTYGFDRIRADIEQLKAKWEMDLEVLSRTPYKDVAMSVYENTGDYAQALRVVDTMEKAAEGKTSVFDASEPILRKSVVVVEVEHDELSALTELLGNFGYEYRIEEV